jgi:hypothetical protein
MSEERSKEIKKGCAEYGHVGGRSDCGDPFRSERDSEGNPHRTQASYDVRRAFVREGLSF